METVSIKIAIFLVVVAIFLILFGIFKIRNGEKSILKAQHMSRSEGGSHFLSAQNTGNGFHAQLFVESEQDDDDSCAKVMCLQVKGLLSYYTESFPVLLEVRYLDITEGNKAPKMIQFIDDKNEITELFETKDFTPPNEEIVIKNWNTISKIPTQKLIFPKHGKRRIKVFLVVSRKADDVLSNNSILTSAECECDYMALAKGYDEIRDSRKYFEKDVMKIVKNMIEHLGEADVQDVSSLIHNWIQNSHIYIENDISRAEDRMIRHYKSHQWLNFFRKNNMDICDNMKKYAQINELYSAIDLFLEIASFSKDSFTMDDLRELDKIALKFDLDITIYNEKKHKKTGFLMRRLVSEENTQLELEIILGIDSTWTKEKKSEYLCTLYSRWNPIQSHRNLNKRRQADDMVKLIARYENLIS